MMNLTQLGSFIRVAEMGSFSKAAIELEIAQPALSRQVRLLEADLGVTLLQRTGRGVVLTDVGKRLYDHGVAILQLVARAREDLSASRGEPAGRVAVGLPPTMGRMLTVPLIERFERELPKARLAIVEGLSAHIVEWIATGRIELGLVHNPGPNPAIDTLPVLQEALCLVSAAASARRAHKKAIKLTELPRWPLVVPERNHAFRKLLEAQAALAGVKLKIASEVSSVQSILELVRHGHGHAVLPRSAVLASEHPKQFATHALADPSLKSNLCLAISAHKPATPLIKRASRLLQELLAERFQL